MYIIIIILILQCIGNEIGQPQNEETRSCVEEASKQTNKSTSSRVSRQRLHGT